MREMLLANLAFLLIVLVHRIRGSDTAECYLDTYEWKHDNGKIRKLPGLKKDLHCTLSNKSTNGCEDFRGRGTAFDWNTETENIDINVERWIIDSTDRFNTTEVVFSVTISNIWFHKLDIRVEDRNEPSQYGQHCQTIEFNRNKLPDRIKVHIMGWEETRVVIQFLGTGDNAKFFREFTMIAHEHTGEQNVKQISKDQVFGYVDTTYSSEVKLFVVPLSEDYKVDRYIGELRENINKKFTVIGEPFNLTEGHFTHKVSVTTIGAAYDFKITPVVNGTHCPYSQIAGFNMSRFHYELLVLILIAVVVPIASFFILRRLCTLYRNWAWRYIKVHLMIVYLPTHPSHVKVVEQLALYLTNCNIDVTMDKWDIEKRDDRNPSLWCDEAFRKANVVVVVSSPPKTDYSYSIYTSAPQAHRLIEENYPRNDKKYVAVLLPYCSREDIPPVARKFRRVRLPQQCKKLLIRCHKTDYTNMFHDWKNNQELIKSIEIAELEIRRPRPISDSNNRNESNEVTFSGPEDDSYSDTDDSDDEGFELEEVISDNPVFNTPLGNLNLTASKSESESDDDNESLGH